MEVDKLKLPDYEEVSGVGFLKQFSVKETYPMHTHDGFYEVFYIQKGKAIHRVNGEVQSLSKGSFVLIRPNDIHQYEFLNTYDIEIISCGINMELMQAACQALEINPDYFLDLELPPHIILSGYNFSDIERKLNIIPNKRKGNQRRRYFLSILPQLLYIFIEMNSNKNVVIPVWLTNLIETMNDKEIFVAGLSKVLEISNVSQEHLTRELKKHMGLTPTEFINIKRMNYAADLLISRKYEIIDICYMCGFNNLSYFYQMFKKNFNCSPKHFAEKTW